MSDRSGQSQDEPGDESEQEAPPPPTWQWMIAAVSTLALLGLLGFVLYEAITGTGLPPVVTVRPERVLETPNGYLVEVGVYNTGGTTAAALQIEGTLKRDTATVETSTATITFVPANSEREAGLYFTKDPRQHRLETPALGYDHP